MARLVSMALLIFLSSGMMCSSTAGGDVVVKVPCEGKVGECLWEEGVEMEMESEVSRRLLWAAATQKTYISYEALKGDVVPCTKPGVPYYNCHALPKANPYTRGCQIISGCRGGSP